MAGSGLAPGDPERVGTYWVAGRLGEGGQGVVYEAYDADARRVAIKVLRGSLGDSLDREVRAAQRVASFCTAKLLHADMENDPPYLVSEYVEGPSLRQAVRDGGGPFEGDALHRLAIAVATALAAIHEAGVIHRDLKPDNVLLSPDGPRVIDFGIARTADMSITSTASVSGTPTYMAPEVFAGERAAAAADVFAWGAVILFAATGQDPFRAENLAAVIHRVLSLEPDVSGLPEPLSALVGAALAKAPADRPTARELLLALVGGKDSVALLSEGSRAATGLAAPGFDPALGERAEAAYLALDEPSRVAAPGMFLRLVAADEDGDAVPRRASRTELDGAGAVVTAFAAAELLVEEGESVRFAHPALPRAWARLREWIDAEREGLPVHHRLAVASRQWEAGGRRDGDVLQGAALDSAVAWAIGRHEFLTLTGLERAYLERGRALGRRRVRLRRLLTTTLVVLLVLSVSATVFADRQRRTAEQRQTQVVKQRDQALARSLVATAGSLRRDDPRLATLLNVAAWQVSPQTDELGGLLTAVAHPVRDVFTPAEHDPSWGSWLLSRDGRRVVAFTDGTPDRKVGIKVWDLATRAEVTGLKVAALEDKREQFVYWADDQARYVTGGQSVDLVSGQVLSDQGTCSCVVLDRDTAGDQLVERRDDKNTLSFVPSGGKARLLTEGGTGSAILSSTGRAALIEVDRGLEVRDTGDAHVIGRLTIELSSGGEGISLPVKMAISPDGGVVAAVQGGDGGWGKDVRVWRVGADQGQSLHFAARGIRMSRKGDFLAAWSTRQLRVWRLGDLKELATWNLSSLGTAQPKDVAFWPEGDALTVTDGRSVRVISLGRTARLGDAPPARVLWAAFSADGGRFAQQLAAADADPLTADSADVAVTDMQGRATPLRIHQKGDQTRWPLALSADGALLATVSEKETRLWDVSTGKRLPAKLPALVPAFDPGGRYLAGESEGKALVWDLRDPARPVPVNLPVAGAERVIGFVAPGRLLAGTAHDTVLVDLGSGKVSHQPAMPEGVFAISRDGRWAVISEATDEAWDVDSSDIGLWDLRTGRRSPGLLRGHSRLVTAAAFSPDGKLLVTGSKDGTVRLWDVATHAALGPAVEGHAAAVAAVWFAPDGRTFRSAGEDYSIDVYDADPGRLVARACERVGRRLTGEEWSRYLADIPYREVCPNRAQG